MENSEHGFFGGEVSLAWELHQESWWWEQPPSCDWESSAFIWVQRQESGRLQQEFTPKKVFSSRYINERGMNPVWINS